MRRGHTQHFGMNGIEGDMKDKNVVLKNVL